MGEGEIGKGGKEAGREEGGRGAIAHPLRQFPQLAA